MSTSDSSSWYLPPVHAEHCSAPDSLRIGGGDVGGGGGDGGGGAHGGADGGGRNGGEGGESGESTTAVAQSV